ncbi:outer membrane protein assembly factor BamE [uncultured Umboniibacter sp.]|uniref:outer membrane protein assembly factor BamE n=1 Tax=uncultured Umboniibacter sp. TaxID=1798917 RepID=UPI002622F295|nr:outer membrane protein assembly factor BamE [uncultured Umboniibacter sp.]
MKKYTFIVLALATFLALSGCSRFRVYKIDIQQGNVISAEKVEQLEIGMDKSQVRFVLGTPLVADTFNANRWDYYWSLKDADEVTRTKRLILTFDNDLLIEIDSQLDAQIVSED